ncbi:MAG: virulence RhuM family protein [Odoribacter sp.]
MDENRDEIIIYQNEDGTINVDVRFQDETVWLTQEQMASMFGKGRSTITEHISNIFKEGELHEDVVCREFRHTTLHGAIEGKTQEKSVKYYNLDVIISVGYRVKSLQGTQFRIWATQKLRDYIIKGFVLNDERFKTGSSMNYFRELLDRIREIRLSEKVFYQQIKDIYATSIDYDPSLEMTQRFFKEIQNKLLWAISGQTAAELIYYRANAELPQMGLMSTKIQNKLRKADIEIAKNYLKEEEVSALKLLVEQYLAFAEAQALANKPMYMRDWSDKLSMILTMNERNVITNAGKISHELAMQKVEIEYDKYKQQQIVIEKQQSIKELDQDIRRVKQLAINKKTSTK